jgi:anti-anti-sigma factor
MGGIETPGSELEVLYPHPDAAVVVLHGDHDLATKDQLHETLTGLLDTHRLVVADLSVATFADSSVLRELIHAHNKAKVEDKQFRLQFGTEPIVKRVFEISGLLNVLDWYPTRDESLGANPVKQPDRLL